MNNIPYTVWLALTLVVAVPTVLAIWSRVSTWTRSLAVVAFLLASPVSATALGFALGWPILLVNGITVPAGETVILGAKLLIGQGIYLLVDRGGIPPRYVYMPWSQQMADAVQDAMDEAGEGGETIMKVPPFEWSWDQSNPQFHALPQPKVLPDKIEPPEAPTFDTDRGI